MKISDSLLLIPTILLLIMLGVEVSNTSNNNLDNHPFKGASVETGFRENKTQSLYGKVTSVYDGDTFTANIHLFDNLWLIDEKIRLVGIDAPEITGLTREEGVKSKTRLSEMILGQDVLIEVERSKAREKYGRILGQISTETSENVNQTMIDENLAQTYIIK